MMLPLFTASLTLALGQTPATAASTAAPPEPPVQARLSFLASDADFGEPFSFTLLHAALEARTPELASGLRAEAALSFFVSTSGAQALGFSDNASLLRLRFRPSGWAPGEGLSLTAYPLSSTRLRMGYEHPVTWARQAYTSPEFGGEPALELRLSQQRGYGYAAVKSALVRNALDLGAERRLALLAGAGVDVLPSFRVELEGATVDRGPAPASAMLGVEQPVRAWGLSGRVQWHHGAPVGPNVDLTLYEGDPEFYERFFTPETYPGGISATVSLEGSVATQALLDPEVSAADATQDEGASAAALVARLKTGFLRLHALAYYRTVTFIQLDVPGFPPFTAFRENSDPRPEVSASLGADYHFEGLGLTPGLLVRATVPAAFHERGVLGPLVADRVLVLRGRNQLSVLPDDEDRLPVLTVKATARWDLGQLGGVLGELFYIRDPNRTSFRDTVTGVSEPYFIDPHGVGGKLLLQLRF